MTFHAKFLMLHIAGTALFLTLLASACTTIYFEKPVPQGGTALQAIPPDWAGVYAEVPTKTDASAQPSIYRECLRLEISAGSKLLVTEEVRIHESDMPRLRADLEEQKRSGKLDDYLLTEGYLFATTRVHDENKPGTTTEQQIARIFRQGPWYIIGGTPEPLILFDLAAGQTTGFDVHHGVGLSQTVLPNADSVSTTLTPLQVRQKGKGYYFNTWKKENGLWELYYVTQPEPGVLIVKTSTVQDKDALERRLDHYNAITPFIKEGDNNYRINPTDQALEQLLSDDKLLETTRLEKISGE